MLFPLFAASYTWFPVLNLLSQASWKSFLQSVAVLTLLAILFSVSLLTVFDHAPERHESAVSLFPISQIFIYEGPF